MKNFDFDNNTCKNIFLHPYSNNQDVDGLRRIKFALDIYIYFHNSFLLVVHLSHPKLYQQTELKS